MKKLPASKPLPEPWMSMAPVLGMERRPEVKLEEQELAKADLETRTLLLSEFQPKQTAAPSAELSPRQTRRQRHFDHLSRAMMARDGTRMPPRWQW